MATSPADWLRNGTGLAPRISWAFSTEAELVCLTHARESGDVFAADRLGALYRLNRAGRIQSMTCNLKDIRCLSFSDTGDAGFAVVGDDSFCALDAKLNVVWSAESPCKILGAEIDTYGHNIAMSLDNSDTVLLNIDKKKLNQFHTERPLKHLRFCTDLPRIIGAGEYGHLCCVSFDGQEIWHEKLWCTIGDLSITERAKTIYLAGFAHGIQTFDADGNNEASFIIEGTPSRVSVSHFGDRVVASTVEQQLYWLDSDGTLLWAAMTPEEVVSVICDPLGEWLILGLQSGRVLRLDWETDT
jgi:hypothetical protein